MPVITKWIKLCAACCVLFLLAACDKDTYVQKITKRIADSTVATGRHNDSLRLNPAPPVPPPPYDIRDSVAGIYDGGAQNTFYYSYSVSNDSTTFSISKKGADSIVVHGVPYGDVVFAFPDSITNAGKYTLTRIDGNGYEYSRVYTMSVDFSNKYQVKIDAEDIEWELFESNLLHGHKRE